RFFMDRLGYIQKTLEHLDSVLSGVCASLYRNKEASKGAKNAQSGQERTGEWLSSSIPELYLLTKKLELFRELNIEAFRKLLKKYDKRRRSTDGARTFEAFRFPFDEAAANVLENLEKKMIKLVGDRKRAMTSLRVPGLSQEKVKLS
ncbi:unnamed protein product, partial [Oikopleura dioica]